MVKKEISAQRGSKFDYLSQYEFSDFWIVSSSQHGTQQAG